MSSWRDSQYLQFESQPSASGKTEVVTVVSVSSGYPLGWIKWYGPWRQYCFFPATDTLFNTGCLNDVHGKIVDMMAARREA